MVNIFNSNIAYSGGLVSKYRLWCIIIYWKRIHFFHWFIMIMWFTKYFKLFPKSSSSDRAIVFETIAWSGNRPLYAQWLVVAVTWTHIGDQAIVFGTIAWSGNRLLYAQWLVVAVTWSHLGDRYRRTTTWRVITAQSVLTVSRRGTTRYNRQ